MQRESEKKSKLQEYVREFLEYCEIEKNRSRKTIETYAHFLRRLTQYAASKGLSGPKQIDADFVRGYRLFLNRLVDDKGKNLKLISQSYHVIALRAFLKYLQKRDIETLAPEKIELAKNPSRQIESLEMDELQKIMKAVEQETEEILRLRDRAILLTLFSTGLRVSELVSLKQQAVNVERGEFTVRGKGDKLRLVFLSPDAAAAIKQYVKKRTDNHPALFIAHSSVGQSVTKEIEAFGKGLRVADEGPKAIGLSARSVQRLIHKYAMLAGITHKVSPHTLRHAFATDLLRNGADIRSVQTMLGHASITTTQIYTHVTNEGLREAHKKYHNKKL